MPGQIVCVYHEQAVWKRKQLEQLAAEDEPPRVRFPLSEADASAMQCWNAGYLYRAPSSAHDVYRIYDPSTFSIAWRDDDDQFYAEAIALYAPTSANWPHADWRPFRRHFRARTDEEAATAQRTLAPAHRGRAVLPVGR